MGMGKKLPKDQVNKILTAKKRNLIAETSFDPGGRNLHLGPEPFPWVGKKLARTRRKRRRRNTRRRCQRARVYLTSSMPAKSAEHFKFSKRCYGNKLSTKSREEVRTLISRFPPLVQCREEILQATMGCLVETDVIPLRLMECLVTFHGSWRMFIPRTTSQAYRLARWGLNFPNNYANKILKKLEMRRVTPI